MKESEKRDRLRFVRLSLDELLKYKGYPEKNFGIPPEAHMQEFSHDSLRKALRRDWRRKVIDRLVARKLLARKITEGRAVLEVLDPSGLKELAQDFDDNGLKLAWYIFPSEVRDAAPLDLGESEEEEEDSEDEEPANEEVEKPSNVEGKAIVNWGVFKGLVTGPEGEPVGGMNVLARIFAKDGEADSTELICRALVFLMTIHKSQEDHLLGIVNSSKKLTELFGKLTEEKFETQDVTKQTKDVLENLVAQIAHLETTVNKSAKRISEFEERLAEAVRLYQASHALVKSIETHIGSLRSLQNAVDALGGEVVTPLQSLNASLNTFVEEFRTQHKLEQIAIKLKQHSQAMLEAGELGKLVAEEVLAQEKPSGA